MFQTQFLEISAATNTSKRNKNVPFLVRKKKKNTPNARMLHLHGYLLSEHTYNSEKWQIMVIMMQIIVSYSQ